MTKFCFDLPTFQVEGECKGRVMLPVEGGANPKYIITARTRTPWRASWLLTLWLVSQSNNENESEAHASMNKLTVVNSSQEEELYRWVIAVRNMNWSIYHGLWWIPAGEGEQVNVVRPEQRLQQWAAHLWCVGEHRHRSFVPAACGLLDRHRCLQSQVTWIIADLIAWLLSLKRIWFCLNFLFSYNRTVHFLLYLTT